MRTLGIGSLALLLLTAVFAGCSHRPLMVNAPLPETSNVAGYRFSAHPEDDELMVVLTFSGGGTRAAAFEYGVLRGLEALRLPDGRSLLDEVDVISSVSGGSFTAMHYGLFGREGFENFERNFLRTDVQKAIIDAGFLSPRGLLQLAGAKNRVEIAADYYDRKIFEGRTFADLLTRNRRPFIIVNSSEVSLDAHFEFTQTQFDMICSDLQQLPVAYAVAASSGVPGLFSALPVRNFSSQCSYPEPKWVETALNEGFEHPLRFHDAQVLRAYRGRAHPYLHLVDGGVVDNLGLRVVVNAIQHDDVEFSIRRLAESGATRRVVIIIVNAAANRRENADEIARLPFLRELHQSVGDPTGIVGVDSLELFSAQLREWRLRCELPSKPGDGERHECDVEFFPAYLSLAGVPDPGTRKFLQAVPTSFLLSEQQVDGLIVAGSELVTRSPVIQQLLRSLESDRPETP